MGMLAKQSRHIVGLLAHGMCRKKLRHVLASDHRAAEGIIAGH